jgi:multiple sugar transport system substrate-binding protein
MYFEKYNTRGVAKGAISLAASLLLLLSGCSHSSNQDVNQVQSGKVVITYWNGFTGPDGETMSKLVNEFQKENPDIKVNSQIIPWGTYYNKLTLAMAYGGTPDLFIIQAARFPEYCNYGVLHPIGALEAADKNPLTANDFMAVPWKETFFKGVQYGLPLDTWPAGLYYNTRLFKEAGIVDEHGNAKPPTTLAEFIEDGKKLTKDTDGSGSPTHWGYCLTNLHGTWSMLAHQYGGDFVAPDGKHGALYTAAGVQATQLMHDFVYKYKIAPPVDGIDQWLSFRTNKVGMIIDGIYMLAQLQKEQHLEFAGAPVPQFGPHKGAWCGSHILCQPSKISPAHAKAAWRLMRFLSDHSYDWAVGGQVPNRKSILNSPQFKALQVQHAFSLEMPYLHYDPQIPEGDSLNQYIDPAIEAGVEEFQPIPDALKDGDRRMNQSLGRS